MDLQIKGKDSAATYFTVGYLNLAYHYHYDSKIWYEHLAFLHIFTFPLPSGFNRFVSNNNYCVSNLWPFPKAYCLHLNPSPCKAPL